MVIAISVLFGCGKDIPSSKTAKNFWYQDYRKSDQEIQEILEKRLNDGFQFSCEDHFKLVRYVEANHVLKGQIDVFKRLETAANKVLKKGRLPTPYFSKGVGDFRFLMDDGNHLVSVPAIDIGYVQFKSAHFNMNPFNSESSFCESVEQLSKDMKRDFEKRHYYDDTIRSSLAPLILKSIFRYFVTGLDPHSYFIELGEKFFIDQHLSRKLQRDLDDNMYIQNFSQTYSIVDSNAFPSLEFEGGNENDGVGLFWSSASNVIYTRIDRFSEKTADTFKELYEKNVQHNGCPSALILDLRTNSGGSTFEAHELLELFLTQGPTIVLSIKPENGSIQYMPSSTASAYFATSGNEIPGIQNLPIVILVSRASASSAEIFADALQVHGKAILVGERTYGKAVGQFHDFMVQDLPAPFSINSTSILNLTTFYAYSPAGYSWQKVGAIPDIEVQQDEDFVFDVSKDERETFWPHALEAPSAVKFNGCLEQVYCAPWFPVWKMHLSQQFSQRRFSLAALMKAIPKITVTH
ncbi:MAG: hypothetical protein HY390_01235 [Deltaproteobacteria bacterium]|nr:hypothetical protein [Deltaproteobacteria bacterium]